MHTQTIAEMSQALASGHCSSVELTEATLQRIEQYDPKLNCFISVLRNAALAQAKQADEQRARGTFTPLTGIPLAHKDIFCTTGIKTSCGSKMLDNFIAPYDATVVERCHQAGTVLVGKTNMDEFAMGSSNETSYYGAVHNPWQHDCVPGGSSGGSAAAVAARLVSAATGTDTGGSVRQPAALCGVTGLKPTYGRVSRYGMIAFASSLDQAGLFTQTAEDCALLLNQIAGSDERDSTCLNVPTPDYTETLSDSLKGLRIGLPSEYFADGLEAGVATSIQDALRIFEKLGASLHDIHLPTSSLAVQAYYVVAPAECSSNLSRYDGVRFGYRCADPEDLTDLFERSRGEGFGDEVKRRIMMGTYVLSAGYYDAYYVKAQKIRRLISNDFQQAFADVDVILGPTAPTPAFKIGEKTDDPLAMYLSDVNTIPTNLAGLPGLSIPAGFSQQLPVGLQLIGNYLQEARLLNVAHQFQQHTDWHQRAPDMTSA